MKEPRGPGLFGATVGISAVVTAGFGWAEVLLGWGLSLVTRLVLPKNRREYGKCGAWVLLILGTLVLGGVVLAAEQAFPEDGTFPFVSAGLLLLLYRTMIGEEDTGRMVSNVLGMVMLVLLGALLVFGFGTGNTEGLRIGEFRWSHVWITLAITSVWWLDQESWGWFGSAAVVSVGLSGLCGWVLGSALVKYTSFPLYRTVQSMNLLGTMQRFEALLAASVLLGTYGVLSRVGDVLRDCGTVVLPEVSRRVWCGIAVVTAFLVEWGYRKAEMDVKWGMTTAFWAMVPVFALLVVILRKMKKELDKNGDME